MELVAGATGLGLVGLVLWDGFKIIIKPGFKNWRFLPSWYFYGLTWLPWRAFGRRMKPGGWRDSWLGIYGPLSSIFLLFLWAFFLILGFALIQWALGLDLNLASGRTDFAAALYMSGVTLFTLGYGDITPRSEAGRITAVAEAGVGFAFLAIVIGYLPVLYQTFSRREVAVSSLYSRAGTPPTAGELLARYGRFGELESVEQVLQSWENFAGELSESHLSLPVLTLFRSNHSRQSWVAALATMLDVCALVLVGINGIKRYQAQITFSVGRQFLIDICQQLNTPPIVTSKERLAITELAQLREGLAKAGVELRTEAEADKQLAELRGQYEPYLYALAEGLLLELPGWLAEDIGLICA